MKNEWKEKRLLTKVAQMYYDENKTQQEIADKYGISRPSVSRLLQKAREKGIVEIKVHNEFSFTVLEKELELKEHFSGTGAVPGGTPGVDANIPGYAQIQTGDSEQQRSEVIKNFDINEIHENLTVAQGAVNKLTVSVVVNRELNDSEKDSIAFMVGNAIGYDPERDQISIEGMEFKNDMAKLFADELARQQREKERLRYFKIIGIALTAILVFIVTRTIVNRRKIKLEEEKLAQEMLAMQQAAATTMQEEAIEVQDSGAYDKIEKHARRQPEDVAKVLKTWLSED